MLARRLLLLLPPLLFVAVPAAAAQGQWDLLSQPRAIVLFRHAVAPGSDEPPTTARALSALSNWTGPGVLVAVTHQVNIHSLTGVSPSEGEGVIVRMEDRTPIVMGRLLPPAVG